MRSKVQVCIGILFLLAGGAKGQILVFTPPGGPEGRPETVQKRLEREISEASHHLGPVRITPLAGFRDVAYVRDLFSSQVNVRSDVTATVGAGFRAYLRTGRKVTWVAQVLPEYVWWNKRTDARRLNLSGGLETVLLLNRLTIDMAASRVEQQRIITPELAELVSTATDLGRLDAELELTDKLRPFVSARLTRQEGLVEDREDEPAVARVEQLDRDEQLVRAGLHWYPRDGWTIGLGAERSQADFESSTLDSSNEGTAPVLELSIDRPHFFFRTDLAARSLTATEGSRFVGFDGLTGSFAVSLVPRNRLEFWAYGHRDLLYSLSQNYPYLLDQRLGLALGITVSDRVTARLFAETGTDEFTAFSPATTPERTDDLTAYGGSLRFLLARGLSLGFQATRIELDSNLPGADRSYTSGGLSLSLGGNLAGRNL